MHPEPREPAQVRFDNAMALFEEFVRSNVKHPDAATLRGLEGRFAARLHIQPSYWSQIKNRSRQIGDRLARQFEQLSHKPVGWMDQSQHPGGTAAQAPPGVAAADVAAGDAHGGAEPRDDDERFIVGLVLTYYRSHPQRARIRLLDLLGEVLAPAAAPHAAAPRPVAPRPGARAQPGAPIIQAAPAAPVPEDPQALWERTRAAVAPLKRKR